MRQVIVIPARMSGSRLPGKPLLKIRNKEMIAHVWEACVRVLPPEQVYVATEDVVIQNYCNDRNMQCINTGPATTAIDRIKLFSDHIEADIYLNVQGDEPLVNIHDLHRLIEYSALHPDRVVFGKAPANKKEFDDISKAKVVCSLSGRLLYSSRAGIPISKKGEFVRAERAIWLYAFNKCHLDAFFSAAASACLEALEDNEVIRFLELDIPVYCIDMIGDSWAVDEPKDLAIVEKTMLERGV